MTIHDYHQVMSAVGIAELKAKLSQHLRTVRQGHTVTVMDRDQPIANIVPHQPDESFRVRKPAPDAPALHDIPLPEPLDLDIDIVDLLLAERQIDR
ncbi:MAG: hypothetical protein GY719_21605 [bacterium]|nr:hypothetical protein [bacterium]